MRTRSPRTRRGLTAKLAVGVAVAGLGLGGLVAGAGPASAGTTCGFEDNTSIFSCNIDQGGGYFHYVNSEGASEYYYWPF